jgi:hypothetical protein
MRAREAAVSAVSEPEKNADSTIKSRTAASVRVISRGMMATRVGFEGLRVAVAPVEGANQIRRTRLAFAAGNSSERGGHTSTGEVAES